MKARLFVVNEQTFKKTMENMEVFVFVPEPKSNRWNQVLLDIVCDLMQISIGDYIFLWESGAKNIYGVFRAVSKPFYKKTGANDIFRIKIAEAYSFDKPINEYDVINNPYMKNHLWNIIGKKVAGKSRATSPITGDEMEFLIQSLIAVNNNCFKYEPNYQVVDVENELAFDFTRQYDGHIPRQIAEYKFSPISVLDGVAVKYEKSLEGILNCCFRDKNKKTISQLSINIDNVNWYANYLPYGLEGSEIDYMVMESVDGINTSRIDVIELMSGIIDVDHINRCLQYSKWVSSSLTNDNNIVRPILICGPKSITAKKGGLAMIR